ncbi:hypothetical protein QYF36_015226 [Acer negundo]|nr:hypothetical protein QYF36_015226 [Acer negundo]
MVDASTAELLAIQKVCRLCFSKAKIRGKSISIESDSKLAVLWVNDPNFGHLKEVGVIYDIREKLRFLGNTKVNFTSRFSNQMADGLAKMGLLRDGENVTWNVF